MTNPVPVHVIKTYGGIIGIAPLIHNLGSRWRLVVTFTFQSLYPWRNRFRYPLNKGPGETGPGMDILENVEACCPCSE
jgi:hypothetical protein